MEHVSDSYETLLLQKWGKVHCGKAWNWQSNRAPLEQVNSGWVGKDRMRRLVPVRTRRLRRQGPGGTNIFKKGWWWHVLNLGPFPSPIHLHRPTWTWYCWHRSKLIYCGFWGLPWGKRDKILITFFFTVLQQCPNLWMIYTFGTYQNKIHSTYNKGFY